MLRVKHLCSLYSLRYVKRCNRRWIDSVDPHKNRSTDLNFCCLVCLLQWRTLFQHTYLVKMCYILLIFVAKFQNFSGATAPNPTPLSAPILLPPEHFYSPPDLWGSRWNTDHNRSLLVVPHQYVCIEVAVLVYKTVGLLTPRSHPAPPYLSDDCQLVTDVETSTLAQTLAHRHTARWQKFRGRLTAAVEQPAGWTLTARHSLSWASFYKGDYWWRSCFAETRHILTKNAPCTSTLTYLLKYPRYSYGQKETYLFMYLLTYSLVVKYRKCWSSTFTRVICKKSRASC